MNRVQWKVKRVHSTAMAPERKAECHPDRAYVAKGLCRHCYGRSWRERIKKS